MAYLESLLQSGMPDELLARLVANLGAASGAEGEDLHSQALTQLLNRSTTDQLQVFKILKTPWYREARLNTYPELEGIKNRMEARLVPEKDRPQLWNIIYQIKELSQRLGIPRVEAACCLKYSAPKYLKAVCRALLLMREEGHEETLELTYRVEYVIKHNPLMVAYLLTYVDLFNEEADAVGYFKFFLNDFTTKNVELIERLLDLVFGLSRRVHRQILTSLYYYYKTLNHGPSRVMMQKQLHKYQYYDIISTSNYYNEVRPTDDLRRLDRFEDTLRTDAAVGGLNLIPVPDLWANGEDFPLPKARVEFLTDYHLFTEAERAQMLALKGTPELKDYYLTLMLQPARRDYLWRLAYEDLDFMLELGLDPQALLDYLLTQNLFSSSPSLYRLMIEPSILPSLYSVEFQNYLLRHYTDDAFILIMWLHLTQVDLDHDDFWFLENLAAVRFDGINSDILDYIYIHHPAFDYEAMPRQALPERRPGSVHWFRPADRDAIIRD